MARSEAIPTLGRIPVMSPMVTDPFLFKSKGLLTAAENPTLGRIAVASPIETENRPPLVEPLTSPYRCPT